MMKRRRLAGIGSGVASGVAASTAWATAHDRGRIAAPIALPPTPVVPDDQRGGALHKITQLLIPPPLAVDTESRGSQQLEGSEAVM